MKFTPIGLADFTRLQPFFIDQPYPLCSYSLPSILAWSNHLYHPTAFVDGDCLIIGAEFSRQLEKRHLILPIAAGGRLFSPEALQDLALNAGFDNYWFVPEAYLQEYGRATVAECFDIVEQPGYHDYIYRTEDLAGLKGNRYAKKRNLINQFQRRYVDTGRVEMGPIAPGNVEACLDFLDKWCAERDCDGLPDDDLACEKQALITTLENIAALDVRGLLLRIDGAVCAFGVASQLTPDMGILQFEKADAAFKGLYQYFDNACARQLFKGCVFINKESDMEMPGLAKAKKSYHPVRIEKSYQLVLR